MKLIRSLTILFSVLSVFVFLSCEKEKLIEEHNNSIKRIKITSAFSNNYSSSEYDITYDSQNRIVEFGSDKFIYGDNGKVERREFKNPDPEFSFEYSYEWDNKGRLVRIRVTSRNNTVDFFANDISLTKNLEIAQFEYDSNQNKPSKIHWRDISGVKGNTLIFSKLNRISYIYEGENVRTRIREDIELPNQSNSSPSHLISYFKYSNHPHYLKSIYDQLGFNPINLFEVVTSNLPESVSESFFSELHNIPQADWQNSGKYELKFDEKSRPAEINLYQSVNLNLGNESSQPALLSSTLLSY